MSFAEIILKNLQQRTTRTVLTIVGLAVAVAAITTLWNIAWGYVDSSRNFYSARGVDIVVVRAGVSNRLTSRLSLDLAKRVRSVPGVDAVDGSLTEMVSLGEPNLLGIPLRGLELSGFSIGELKINDGHPLRLGDRGFVLLGNALAESLGKRAGQPIEIEGQGFQVAGVFQADNPFDSNSIIAPLDEVQKLMDRPGVVAELQVRAMKSVSDESSLRSVCRSIESLGDDSQQPLGLRAQVTRQFITSATEAKLTSAMAWATTAIVLVLSFVGMLNTVLMSVLERTRELGVLRAMGWKRNRVAKMIVGESVAISLAAATIGGTASWMLIRLLSRWSWTSLLVPSSLSNTALAVGFATAMIAGVVGSLYPALRAASVPPIESLRYE